ncbi:MAG: mechanosensitive ion channel, partial [Coriobacteriia bacterium]|nr:mechanosensitive ion channel [Coriobacteriia bacterium]
PGEFVRLESGQEGRVRDVTWRNTTIETVSNDVVIVPNATLGKSVITNFSTTSEEHHVILPVSVAYGGDLVHVERVARSVAEDVIRTAEGAVADFEPVVRFRDFADSGIEMVVVVRAASYPDRYVVRDALLKALHARFAAEGIEIPFPQRVVHMAESPAEG